MIIIGITGLIASGKTEVCKIIQKKYKIPVIYTDKLAKHLYKKDKNIKLKVIDTFGIKILKNNSIDYQKLGKIVFSNLIELRKLEKIIHPEIIKFQNRLIDFFKKAKKNKKILAIESALLVKLKQYKVCNYIIYVEASEKIRKDRVKDTLIKRQEYQNGFEKPKADYTIKNNSTKKNIEIQVDSIINDLYKSL